MLALCSIQYPDGGAVNNLLQKLNTKRSKILLWTSNFRILRVKFQKPVARPPQWIPQKKLNPLNGAAPHLGGSPQIFCPVWLNQKLWRRWRVVKASFSYINFPGIRGFLMSFFFDFWPKVKANMEDGQFVNNLRHTFGNYLWRKQRYQTLPWGLRLLEEMIS